MSIVIRSTFSLLQDFRGSGHVSGLQDAVLLENTRVLNHRKQCFHSLDFHVLPLTLALQLDPTRI